MIVRLDVTPIGYTGARPEIMAALADRLPRASSQIRELTFTRKAVHVSLEHRRWTAERFDVEADMLCAVGEGVVANVRGSL